MSKGRIWLFRALILLGIIGLAATWVNAWWVMDIDRVGKGVVHIYPTGLRHTLTVTYYQLAKGAAEMPAWFTPAAWAFFAAMILALVAGMWIWLKDIKGRLLLAAVGFAYFMTPVVMAVVAALKLGPTRLPLQGSGFYSAGGYYNSALSTRLLPAFYIALGVGVFIMLLALLRDRIIGKAAQTEPKGARPAPISGAGGYQPGTTL